MISSILNLAQIDVPSEVWGQYPLLLLGVALGAWLAREWVKNEREWREFTTRQVTDKEAANLAILKLVQDGHKEQVATIEANHQKQLSSQAEALSRTYDTELERVLDLLAKAGRNGPNPG